MLIPSSLTLEFDAAFQRILPAIDDYVPQIVSLILCEARRHRASDVHLVPSEDVVQMFWRVDGVLHLVAGFDRELAGRILARLKVICGLLTYRTEVPQEGRVGREYSTSEVRVTTFPTLYGEKAAIRLFASSDVLRTLSQLGLPDVVLARLEHSLDLTSGVILLTGPSGSGKTTTAYACLRDIVQSCEGTRSVMTLEDPVEVVVEGTTQSQVRPSAGFDLHSGLRSLMRQDPDVIFVGEVRDPATAEAAFQAALTGHLVISTFHAGSCAEAITRLIDMDIEPYLIRSTLQTVICQRLLRRVCGMCPPADSNHTTPPQNSELSDKTPEYQAQAVRCLRCGSTGYHGRIVAAEMLDPDHPEIARSILARTDARHLASMAESTGMETLQRCADRAVSQGLTTRSEVARVLGRANFRYGTTHH